MALGVQNLDMLDLRYFTGSLVNFINTEKPDAVMLVYISNMLGRDSRPDVAPQNKKLYDFR